MSENKRRCRILAHRGASGYAPENTMAAFRLARELGADGLEFDVQVTKDGVPVVIHDEWLERTTNGKGFVNEKTLAELRALDAGSWFDPKFAGERIPTLEEVIAEFGRDLFLNIELKNSFLEMPQLEEKTVGLIREYGIEETVIVSSFDHESMLHLHNIAPDLRTGLLYDCRLVDAPDYAKRISSAALHPLFATVRKDLVQSAHQNGLEVNVWTVNEEAHLQMMIQLGVDSIITNFPDRLCKMLAERK
jgi:glycerophosphoryl diester phosphodiesterase